MLTIPRVFAAQAIIQDDQFSLLVVDAKGNLVCMSFSPDGAFFF